MAKDLVRRCEDEIRAAQGQMAQGRYDEALPLLCGALAEGGESVGEGAWRDLARCLQAIGQDDLARQADAVPLAAEERQLILMFSQFFLGSRLEKQGAYDAAATAFRAALLLAEEADDKVACAGRAASALAKTGDRQGAYRLLLLHEREVREAKDPDCVGVWAANFIELHHELGGKEEPAILRAIRDKLPPDLGELPALGQLPDQAGIQQAAVVFERRLAEVEPGEAERQYRLLLQLATFRAAQEDSEEAWRRLAEAAALEPLLDDEDSALERQILAARFLAQEDKGAKACALFSWVWPRLREAPLERKLEVAGYYLEALGRWAAAEAVPLVCDLAAEVIDLYEQVLFQQPGNAARRQIRKTHQRVFEAALIALLTLAEEEGAESHVGQLLLGHAWSMVLKSRNPELQVVPAPPLEEQARHLRGLEDSFHRALYHELAGRTVTSVWRGCLEKATAYEISTLRTGRNRAAEVPTPPGSGVAIAFFRFRDLVSTGPLLALVAQEGRFRVHPIEDEAGKVIAPLTAWARRLQGEASQRILRGRSLAGEAIAPDGSLWTADLPARLAAQALFPLDLPGLGPGSEAVPWYLFPDGELYPLPIEVLPDPGGGCLGQRLSLRFCLRPSLSASCEEKVDFSRGWLGLGGAPALAAAAGDFHYLQGTRDEVTILKGDLSALGYPAEALFNEEAHVDRLAERLAALRPAVLHLAVHGQSDPEYPDACFLVLADAPGAAEVALLPFRRIRDLPLDGVQLVVLSACSSLIGPSDRSAGIEGIAWAFLQAGAAQVIASRYSVDDTDTCHLMQMLYRHLLKHSVAEALRRMRIEGEQSGTRRREIGAWAVWS